MDEDMKKSEQGMVGSFSTIWPNVNRNRNETHNCANFDRGG